MSFQAYLDNIEAKTGKTPNGFVAMAKEKGFDTPDTKAGVIVAWLKEDFGIGRGHAMALIYVIGPRSRHVPPQGTNVAGSRSGRLPINARPAPREAAAEPPG